MWSQKSIYDEIEKEGHTANVNKKGNKDGPYVKWNIEFIRNNHNSNAYHTVVQRLHLRVNEVGWMVVSSAQRQ